MTFRRSSLRGDWEQCNRVITEYTVTLKLNMVRAAEQRAFRYFFWVRVSIFLVALKQPDPSSCLDSAPKGWSHILSFLFDWWGLQFHLYTWADIYDVNKTIYIRDDRKNDMKWLNSSFQCIFQNLKRNHWVNKCAKDLNQIYLINKCKFFFISLQCLSFLTWISYNQYSFLAFINLC